MRWPWTCWHGGYGPISLNAATAVSGSAVVGDFYSVFIWRTNTRSGASHGKQCTRTPRRPENKLTVWKPGRTRILSRTGSHCAVCAFFPKYSLLWLVCRWLRVEKTLRYSIMSEQNQCTLKQLFCDSPADVNKFLAVASPNHMALSGSHFHSSWFDILSSIVEWLLTGFLKLYVSRPCSSVLQKSRID